MTCPFPSDRPLPAMPAWFLWFCLAALLVLPVIAAFIEDRPPRNEITHESGDENRDGDAGPMLAAT